MNELEKSNVERSTELLMEKNKVKELLEDKKIFDETSVKIQKEMAEFKGKYNREAKLLRERAGRLTEENLAYRKVIEDMKMFFNKVNSD